MAFDGRAYSVLVVSGSEKFNTSLAGLLPQADCEPGAFVTSVAAAKRALLERSYDFVVINAPLRDDSGTRFAIDSGAGKGTVCLLLAGAELYEEVRVQLAECGVFTLQKPTSSSMMLQALKWLAPARERLRKLERKTQSIEEKMGEIRLVNRAKWLLIENLTMAEADAHRYIEKQAMDRCVTRREVAETIIQMYK